MEHPPPVPGPPPLPLPLAGFRVPDLTRFLAEPYYQTLGVARDARPDAHSGSESETS